MDIHARPQQHVGVKVLHLLAHQRIQPLHALGIEGAGQRRAAGQQRDGLTDADAGRAVRGNHRGQAAAAQLLRHAAKRAGIALGAIAGIHRPLTMRQVVQLFGRQLRHKFLCAALAAQNVRKGDILLLAFQGLGQLLQNLLLKILGFNGHIGVGERAVLIHHAFKGRLRLDRHRFAQLFDHLERGLFDAQHTLGIANVDADLDAVHAGFQHGAGLVPGRSRVVVGGKVRKVDLHRQRLAFARRKLSGLGKGRQHLAGIAQLAAGQADVALHHLLAA